VSNGVASILATACVAFDDRVRSAGSGVGDPISAQAAKNSMITDDHVKCKFAAEWFNVYLLEL
jgi:hypothetical protein